MTEHHVKVSREAVPGLELYPWRMTCLCTLHAQAMAWADAVAQGYAHMTEVREEQATAQFLEPGDDPGDDDGEPFDLTPLIKTKLAWDLLDHDSMGEWLPRLGLTPGSDENADLDHRASHARGDLLQPIAGLAETYAALIADIHTAYLTVKAGTENADHDEFTDMIFRITRAGVFTVLCEFLSEGVLAYGPAVQEALA